MVNDGSHCLNAIADNIPVPIFVYRLENSRLKIVYTNFRKLLAASKHEIDLSMMNEDELMKLIHPDDRRAAHEFFVKILGDHLSSEINYRARLNDTEEYQWYHLNGRPVAQDDGSIYAYVVFTNITKEKEMELDALKKEHMYRVISEQSKQLIFEYDQAHRRVIYQMDNSFTRAVCQSQGIPAIVENVPASLISMVDESFREPFLALFEPFDRRSGQRTLKYSVTLAGETHWWRVTSNPLFDQAGNLLTIYCAAVDITDEKMEEAAHDTAQKHVIENYRTQLELLASANPNFVVSYHLNITKNICADMVIQDDQYQDLEKLAASGTADGLFEAVAKTVPDQRISAEMRTEFNCRSLLERFSAGENKVSIEYPCRSVRGGIRWMLGSVNMIPNPETGDVEGIIYSADINDKKMYELVTKQVTEQGFEYIALLNMQTREMQMIQKKSYIEYPKIGEKISYEERRHHIQTNYIKADELDIYNRDSDFNKVKEELSKNGSYIFSFLCTEPSKQRTCQQVKFSWFDESQQIALMVRADVTETYEREQQQMTAIKSALIAAEKANDAKTDFVSRISHDIRTPLGAIANITDFAMEDINDAEKLKDDLQKIKASNEFLLSLVNDVLDISKIESSRIKFYPEAYPFEEYIAKVRNVFEPLCIKKGIHFEINVKRDNDATAIVDKVRFNQITMNLLSNAVKYTPAGGTVTYSSSSRILPDHKIKVQFTISDTGIGMSEVFQRTMFEPFAQELDHPMRDKTIPGSGLGLSLVKKIVDQMGGTIAVSSEIGKGTDITITFEAPLAGPETNAKDHEDNSAASLSVEKLCGKILLVEDNAINMAIEKRILETIGLSVIYAENGRQAVDLFASSEPGEYELVLMDLQMPVMNGYDATVAIRAMDRDDAADVPIVAMTADAYAAALKHCQSIGMTDYVTKPLDVRHLRDTIAKYLKN